MTTRGTPAAQPTPASKRPSKTASTQSLNHLLNFSLPPRQTQQPPSFPRRSRRNGTQQGVWNKERFVNAQYRFVMNPTGDYTVHFADPDIFFQWHDILQVIIPRNSASVSATGGGEDSLQAEGVITCPICLSPPTAPRMTKCGHVYCFPCILHYLSTSDNLKWVRCPICFDSVNERQLKAVVWTDAPSHFDDESDEPHAEASSSSASLDAANPTPQPGSMLRMRLMQRPQITTLALPRSATWPSDLLPPHQAPFHFLPDVYPFAKFMLATPSYLIEYLNRDVAELATERRMLSSQSDAIGVAFVDAASQRLQAQIEKATALDTEPLRDAIDKAFQLQHEIETRASHHQQRRKLEQEIPTPDTDVPEAYLASRLPATTTIPRAPTPAAPNTRSSKQRRNVNPPPPSTSTYYYYQAASGLPVFLHPLDIKILNAHFNGYASFPDTIAVRVEAHSEGAVNDELRRRCKYLAHMPEGADVVFVEADLGGVVGADGLRAFEGALRARRARREVKGRKDDRARARAEEREREKLAQATWRETGSVPAYLAPAPSPPAAEDVAEAESRSTPPPVSGAWGARSFASAAHAGGGGRPASLRPSARRGDEEDDEWDLDIAFHEMEARSGGGAGGGRRNRRSRPMVVLGSGPGRRR